jgi:YVTN family beta-propeller protein
MALSADGKRLYVSTGKGKSVFVIDTTTNKIVTSFEVGQRPWGVALSPDGKTLFTANGPSNDISIVDTATNTVTKKVKATGGPWGIQIVNKSE